MKAILIDDEKHALDALNNLLSEFKEIDVVGMFTNPLQAIEQVQALHYDVAFLDMEMPGIKGLEVAQKLLDLNSSTEVIFVTAYDEYAVDAFEINALDYLLKPVSRKRMTKAIERLNSRKGMSAANQDKTYGITCFGRFQISAGALQDESIKWRTSKVRELFAFLVHHRSEVVHKDIIVENLWPEMENERAVVYLHTCIYQIRKTIKELNLGNQMIVRLVDDGYHLQLNGIYCDVDHYMRIADVKGDIHDDSINTYEEAVKLYCGDYFGNEDFPWSEKKKIELQFSRNELLKKLANYYIHKGMLDTAAKHLQRLIANNPFHEGNHELILRCYAQMGDYKTLNKHYQDMKQIFIKELGIEPSSSIQILFKRLNGK